MPSRLGLGPSEECECTPIQLMEEGHQRQQGEGNTVGRMDVSSRIFHALQMRLSMVLPFVSSNRWHEGMAIGALPQNAYRTARQLDDMANIVLNYALGKDSAKNPAQKVAVVAAYTTLPNCTCYFSVFLSG